MSLLYDDGQLAIATESRRALEASVTLEGQLQFLERTGAFDNAFWRLAREQGWTALTVPEDHGGINLGLVELGLVAFQAGRSLSGAPFVTTNHGVAAALLAGNGAGKDWLSRLAEGAAVGAVAFAEAGSPLPSTPGIRFEKGRLFGSKPAVTAGLHADIAVVLAAAETGPVLVIADLAGMERRALATFDNSRGIADLHFDGWPAEAIAQGEDAIRLGLRVLAEQSVIVAHEQTGGAERLMEIARDYANTRRAFGQPIGAFQSVKHRIAEIYGLVELAKASALHAASRAAEMDFITAAASARISATEAYDTAARDCIQIHGGIGVTWEGALHLHMRRARSLAIEQGNLLFWEDVLVDHLVGAAA